MVGVALYPNPRQQTPASAASLSGTVGPVICTMNTAPHFSLCLTSASGRGLWFDLTETQSRSFLSCPGPCAHWGRCHPSGYLMVFGQFSPQEHFPPTMTL